MEKKRSVGVTVFAWIYMVAVISCAMVAFTSWGILNLPQDKKVGILKQRITQQEGITTVAEEDKFYLAKIEENLPFGILALISTIGLFKLKKWGLPAIIVTAIYGILDEGFELTARNGVHYPLAFGYSICIAVGLLLYFLTIYFFTRPKVKEQFEGAS